LIRGTTDDNNPVTTGRIYTVLRCILLIVHAYIKITVKPLFSSIFSVTNTTRVKTLMFTFLAHTVEYTEKRRQWGKRAVNAPSMWQPSC